MVWTKLDDDVYAEAPVIDPLRVITTDQLLSVLGQKEEELRMFNHEALGIAQRIAIVQLEIDEIHTVLGE